MMGPITLATSVPTDHPASCGGVEGADVPLPPQPCPVRIVPIAPLVLTSPPSRKPYPRGVKSGFYVVRQFYRAESGRLFAIDSKPMGWRDSASMFRLSRPPFSECEHAQWFCAGRPWPLEDGATLVRDLSDLQRELQLQRAPMRGMQQESML